MTMPYFGPRRRMPVRPGDPDMDQDVDGPGPDMDFASPQARGNMPMPANVMGSSDVVDPARDASLWRRSALNSGEGLEGLGMTGQNTQEASDLDMQEHFDPMQQAPELESYLSKPGLMAQPAGTRSLLADSLDAEIAKLAGLRVAY